MGLEYFWGLTSLDINGCRPRGGTIKLSSFTKLKTFKANNCYLKEIKVTNNPELTTLELNNNKLKKLTLKYNPNLEALQLDDNQLTSLDLSSLTKWLISVKLANNNFNIQSGDAMLQSIKEDTCVLLSIGNDATDLENPMLNAFSRRVVYEKLAANQVVIYTGALETHLGSLVLDATHFPDKTFRDAVISAYNEAAASPKKEGDVVLVEDYYGWDNTAKQYIYKDLYLPLEFKGVSTLNLTGFEYFIEIDGLTCFDATIKNFDKVLATLSAVENPFNLEILSLTNCDIGDISEITIPDNIKFIHLDGMKTPLTKLVAGKNTKGLSCDRNRLTSLDISGCNKLVSLSCACNDLTTMVLPETNDFYEDIFEIQCWGNKLSDNFFCTLKDKIKLSSLSFVLVVNSENVSYANEKGYLNGYVDQNRLSSSTIAQYQTKFSDKAIFYKYSNSGNFVTFTGN